MGVTIGIGWDFGGVDIAAMDREKIRAAYAAAHPSESKQKVAANIGQVYRFAHSMVQGSTVVMYDPAERLYHIGVIEGPCKPSDESESLTYTRWTHHLKQDRQTRQPRRLRAEIRIQW